MFHNAAKNTPDALPDRIESLMQKGFSFASVSPLIYKENYEMDRGGRQCLLSMVIRRLP